jgi:hypothetical protein
MGKPDGWDDAPAVQGGFNNPVPGAYVFGIIYAEEKMSSNNNKMLVLSLDIIEGQYKNFYNEKSKRASKDCLLVHRRITEGESSLPYYKGDVKSIEESNAGFKYDFDSAKLRGKIVGGTLREEEYLAKDGTVKSSVKIAFLCSADKARKGEVKAPEKKKINPNAIQFSVGPVTQNDKLPWETNGAPF